MLRKRFASFILAVVLLLAFGASAFADTIEYPKYVTVVFSCSNPRFQQPAETISRYVNWDTEFTFPAAPERPGYVFNGWTRRMFPEQFNPGLPGEYWPGDTARTPATMTGHYEGNGFWTVTNNKMEYTACWVSTKQFVPLDVPYTVSRIRDDSYENGLSMLSTKTLRWSTSDERILKVDPETGRITKDSFSFAKIGKVTIIGTEHDAGEPYVRYRIEAKVIWGEPEWFGWIMAILFFGWIWL